MRYEELLGSEGHSSLFRAIDLSLPAVKAENKALGIGQDLDSNWCFYDPTQGEMGLTPRFIVFPTMSIYSLDDAADSLYWQYLRWKDRQLANGNREVAA